MNRLFVHRRHWLLLVTGLVALGIYLVLNLARERERIEAAERERLTLQSRVIEDNLTRQLGAINLALESIMDELPFWARSPEGAGAAQRRLKGMEVSMPSVRTFLVMDAHGTITHSNREELVGRNLYQREYFQAPLRGKDQKTLYLSPPYKSVLNNYVINLTRSVVDPQGQFAGVVSAVVDPVEIKVLMSSVRYAKDMQATLIHGDGKVVVTEPQRDEVMDKDLAVAGSYFSQHVVSHGRVSFPEGIELASGEKRLPVLRTIQPAGLLMDKPLVVSVTREWDALFVEWKRDVINQSVVYMLFVLLSSTALLSYQRLLTSRRMSAQRLKLATQASGVGIWELDLEKRRYHWDTAMFDLFGQNPATVGDLNNDWQQLLLPGELERMKAATRATIRDNQPFDMTFQIRRPDGEVRFMRNRAALHCDDVGMPSRLIGATEDVTERKMREADLRVAATAFDCQEGIVITDANRIIVRVNKAFTRLFGHTAEELVGNTTQLLQSGRHTESFYADMWRTINEVGAWQGEIWNRRKNGEVFPEWLTISAVRNDEGAVTHYVQTHIDITLRKTAEEEIRQLAFYDPLTSLPNRRLLNDRLHQAVTQARRNRTRLALMYLDLDKFKPVNDAFGHPAGDELLRAVAHRLQDSMRESDTVGRMGGDEFVVLLPVIDTEDDATGVAEKIHAALKRPFVLSGGQSVNISSSAGIAVYPEHGDDEAVLTGHADAALYQAKTAGRDRFVVFESHSPS